MIASTTADYAARVAALKAIPACARYAEEIASAAMTVRPDDPRFDLLIAAVGEEESLWGRALTDGCGDWTLRVGHWVGHPHTAIVHEPPPRWHLPTTREGDVVPGPYAMPEDGLGWGRGLMQLDLALALTVDWRDPGVNIATGARILDAGIRAFPGRLDAGVASYNTGPANVRRSLSSGFHADHTTTGGDYSRRVLARYWRWAGGAVCG